MTTNTPAGAEMAGMFRKKPVVIEASQWHKNGDHPLDYSKDHDGLEGSELRVFTAAERRANAWEGDIVRYYRHPDVSGETPCKHCGVRMHEHGWIDTLEGGHIVCPGDWIVTGVKGEHYPCKPDIFAATYEPAASLSPASVGALPRGWKMERTSSNEIVINGPTGGCVVRADAAAPRQIPEEILYALASALLGVGTAASTPSPAAAVGGGGEAVVWADQIESEVMEVMNGQRKPGKLSVEPIVRLCAYVRTGTTRNAALSSRPAGGEASKDAAGVLLPPDPTPELVAAMAVIESSGTCNGTPTIGMAGAEDAYYALIDAARATQQGAEHGK